MSLSEFTEDRVKAVLTSCKLKEVLASCRELSLQVGGTVGEDLNSCINSIGRLSERLYVDWQGVWHKGAAPYVQQRKTKLVCNNMNEALLLTLELIDHKSGGRLRNPENKNIPKQVDHQTETPKSFPQLVPIPSSSKPTIREIPIFPKRIPTSSPSVVSNDVPMCIKEEVGINLCSIGAPEQPIGSQLASIPEKKAQEMEKVATIESGTRNDNDAIRHLHQVPYSQIILTREYAKLEEDSQKKLHQMAIEKEVLNKKLKDAVIFIIYTSRKAEKLHREDQVVRTMLISKFDRAVKVIRDIFHLPLYTAFPESIRIGMMNILIEHSEMNIKAVPSLGAISKFIKANSPATIQPEFSCLSSLHANNMLALGVSGGGGFPPFVLPPGSNQASIPAFPSHQVPFPLPPLAFYSGPHICFVCGVVVTDASSIIRDPADLETLFVGLNREQVLRVLAAANLGGKGLPVICKSHTPPDILRIVQQNFAGLPSASMPHPQDRKRGNEGTCLIPGPFKDSKPEGAVQTDATGLWKTGKEIKKESPEPKKVKIEPEDE